MRLHITNHMCADFRSFVKKCTVTPLSHCTINSIISFILCKMITRRRKRKKVEEEEDEEDEKKKKKKKKKKFVFDPSYISNDTYLHI